MVVYFFQLFYLFIYCRYIYFSNIYQQEIVFFLSAVNYYIKHDWKFLYFLTLKNILTLNLVFNSVYSFISPSSSLPLGISAADYGRS